MYHSNSEGSTTSSYDSMSCSVASLFLSVEEFSPFSASGLKLQ